MKVKILIVDDEILQVQLISRIIQRYRPDYDVVITHQPLEALELLRTQSFNALMTDVKMPQLSGIDLIREARAMNIEPLEIIILSGFDDFQYARSAIAFEVLEYLLKPIDGTKLQQVLCKLEEKLEEDMQRRQIQHDYSIMKKRQYAAALLRKINGLELSLSEEIAISQYGERMRMALAEGAEDIGAWLSQLPYSACAEPLGNRRHLVFIPAPWGSAEKSLPPLAEGTVTVGLPFYVDNAVVRWAELQEHADTARRLGLRRLIQAEMDDALRTQFSDMVRRQDVQAIMAFAPMLRMAMQSGRMTLASIAAAAQKEIACQVDEKRLPHIYPQREQDLLKVLVGSIAGCDTPEKLCSIIADMLTPLTADEAESSFEQNVRIYVSAHYGEDCSLNEIAQAFHYSSAHFGRLFSARFGSTYTRWLAGYRLEKACELLRSTSLPVNEIASRVGFGTASYLIRQFSKKYGVTPEKYRRKGR